MSETMRNIRAAYQSGVKCFATGEPCKYGSRKLQLRMWWFAGNSDAESGNVDPKMVSNEMFKSFTKTTCDPCPD